MYDLSYNCGSWNIPTFRWQNKKGVCPSHLKIHKIPQTDGNVIKTTFHNHHFQHQFKWIFNNIINDHVASPPPIPLQREAQQEDTATVFAIAFAPPPANKMEVGVNQKYLIT